MRIPTVAQLEERAVSAVENLNQVDQLVIDRLCYFEADARVFDVIEDLEGNIQKREQKIMSL